MRVLLEPWPAYLALSTPDGSGPGDRVLSLSALSQSLYYLPERANWSETVTDFTFLGSKITADGDWSYEIKRHFLLGRKDMLNLDSIIKSRDIILLTKVHVVKATVFPVVKYGCESWTIKKAEHQRIDAFELWCWRRLLRVPWTVRRPSSQS